MYPCPQKRRQSFGRQAIPLMIRIVGISQRIIPQPPVGRLVASEHVADVRHNVVVHTGDQMLVGTGIFRPPLARRIAPISMIRSIDPRASILRVANDQTSRLQQRACHFLHVDPPFEHDDVGLAVISGSYAKLGAWS